MFSGIEDELYSEKEVDLGFHIDTGLLIAEKDLDILKAVLDKCVELAHLNDNLYRFCVNTLRRLDD